MPRYILVISDRRLAVFDAPNFDRANSLKNSADLAATLKDTCSDGAPLWDGSALIDFLIPESHEEEKWQRTVSARTAEGMSNNEGLFVWLIPVVSIDGREVYSAFTMKDEWGLW